MSGYYRENPSEVQVIKENAGLESQQIPFCFKCFKKRCAHIQLKNLAIVSEISFPTSLLFIIYSFPIFD